MNSERPYKICVRCIMDTSDPNITFDQDGVCNHCKSAEKALKSIPYSLDDDAKRHYLNCLVESIKKRGIGKRYDCIIGVSGGIDSTYVAYLVKNLGLRPLAVHLDNGWDSELSVQNIENICKKLNVDLYTHVIDWEEFKDLQLSFLKASTPDSEIPSDHAIYSIMFRIAEKENVNYILAGYNLASEAILPSAWSQGHFDWKYIKSVHKQFGKKKLSNFPHYGFLGYLNLSITGSFVINISVISILDYISYNKSEVKKIITEELGWRDYGGKHCESNYTKIFQSYILPEKFGYDKRRAHLSSLICSKQISREQALTEINRSVYTDKTELENDINYLINKFGISFNEFSSIMQLPNKSYLDYPNYTTHWIILGIQQLKKIEKWIMHR